MIYCKKCKNKLSFFNIYELRDVDCKRIGIFCNICGRDTEERLKEDRFIEEYKNNRIYLKDGRYYPYWECQYFFNSLEEVKVRIDDWCTGVMV